MRGKKREFSGKWENVMKTNKSNGAMPRVRKCGFLVVPNGDENSKGSALDLLASDLKPSNFKTRQGGLGMINSRVGS